MRADPHQVDHGQTLRHYFWKINFNIILPSATRSSKLPSSFRFLNQNALCISILFVCTTRFPPLIFLHLINTNNIWSGAKIMKIIMKQIFSSSCHFLRVWSEYLPHYHILEYFQTLFFRQPGRPSFTPICNIKRNYSSHQKVIQIIRYLLTKKIDVQKSTSSNCNSAFSAFSVFNTQTVRHVLKTLAIFSVHLRQMHYVFHKSITSAILQHFTSITCQHSSRIVNNWPVNLRERYLKTR